MRGCACEKVVSFATFYFLRSMFCQFLRVILHVFRATMWLSICCLAGAGGAVLHFALPYQQVLRDSTCRGMRLGQKVEKEEKVKWKEISLAFLEDCRRGYDEEGSELKKVAKAPERLATFYLVHATDWQLRVAGFRGYSTFFKENTPGFAQVEERPLLIENQDSYAVNTAKAHYLLNERELRYVPIWDLFHKRHNMKLNSYKRSGMWTSIRLQMAVFEVFRGPWGGYAFWRQTIEGMQSYLKLIEEDDPILDLEYEAICKARGKDPTMCEKPDIIEDMKTAKWLEILAPKSCSGRWCSFEQAQKFWEPHLAERLCGTRYLGIQQGWHAKEEGHGKVDAPPSRTQGSCRRG